MLKVVIADPGLREYGGHHPAMISAIANTNAVAKGDITLDIYCNQACVDDFINTTKTAQISIIKHFNTDFYQYFYQSPSQAALNEYINQLSKEYLSVFEKYSQTTEASNNQQQSKTLFLYHTLNGEHAFALAAAIRLYNKRYSTQQYHCVFLMYNPIKFNENGVLNTQHFLNFKLGFNALKKQKNVQFYAAEQELQQHYQYLLDQKANELAIHPCGLSNPQKRNDISNVNQANVIILFTGDAKVNKGFFQLPSITMQLIKNIKDKSVRFIIQYTITNSSIALKNTHEHLLELSKRDNRIQLTARFWSHKEIHENFARANSILFNYDSKIYKNQSSGVLWLAAQHHLKIVSLTSNWLSREAEKLGCQYTLCKLNNLSQKFSKNEVKSSDYFDTVSANRYREQLFQDIGEWLIQRI